MLKWQKKQDMVPNVPGPNRKRGLKLETKTPKKAIDETCKKGKKSSEKQRDQQSIKTNTPDKA